MKAYEAKRLAYNKNKLKNGVDSIDKLIKKASRKGYFELDTFVDSAWGTVYEIIEHYKNMGFKVTSWDKRTGPNSSDTYINISWEG